MRLQVLAILSSLFLSPYLSFAQTEFQRTYGGMKDDDAYHVIGTPDKGLLTIGSTLSFGTGKSDIFMVRLDSVGNMEWSKTYGGLENDYGRYIDNTNDGNYIITGYTSSFDKDFKQIFLMKIDPKGEMLWTKTYGLDRSDYATSVKLCKDGGFIILGETINNIGHEKNSDILVIKTDLAGTVEWSKIYGGEKTDYGYSIEMTKEGGYIIGGETNSYGAGEWDFYAININAVGDVIWSKTYGDTQTDFGRFACVSPDGGFLIAGNSYSFNSADLDVCLIKVNNEGDPEWAKSYSGANTDYLLSMIALKDKGYAFTGYSNSFDLSAEDAFLFFVNKDGKVVWGKSYGGKFDDHGVSLSTVADDGLVIAGRTNSFGTNGGDLYISKTTQKWTRNMCNSSFLRPMVSNIKVKTGKGSYSFELHANETKVSFSSKTPVCAEQILCLPVY